MSIITTAAKASILTIWLSAKFKFWWSSNLRELWKTMIRNQRLLVNNYESRKWYL